MQAALLEKLAAAKAREEEARKIADRDAELRRREEGRKMQAAAAELKSRQELAALQSIRDEQQRKKDEKVRLFTTCINISTFFAALMLIQSTIPHHQRIYRLGCLSRSKTTSLSEQRAPENCLPR